MAGLCYAIQDLNQAGASPHLLIYRYIHKRQNGSLNASNALVSGVFFGWSIGINNTFSIYLEGAPPFGFGFSGYVFSAIYLTAILAIIMGNLFGHFVNDIIARSYVRRHHGIFEPEARLSVLYVAVLLGGCGLILLGGVLRRSCNDFGSLIHRIYSDITKTSLGCWNVGAVLLQSQTLTDVPNKKAFSDGAFTPFRWKSGSMPSYATSPMHSWSIVRYPIFNYNQADYAEMLAIL